MTLIRPLKSSDRAHWDGLWNGYLRFYRQRLPSEVTNATFTRLIDATQQPHGLVAEDGDNLVGFAHYLFHPSSWVKRARMCCLRRERHRTLVVMYGWPEFAALQS